jgi:hypothetical protein
VALLMCVQSQAVLSIAVGVRVSPKQSLLNSSLPAAFHALPCSRSLATTQQQCQQRKQQTHTASA